MGWSGASRGTKGRGWGETKPCGVGMKPYPSALPRPITIPNIRAYNVEVKEFQALVGVF